MFLPCFLLERCSQWLLDYDLNAPSAGGEFIVSIIGSNARRSTCSHVSTPFFVPQTESTASCRRNAPSNPTGGGETAACGRFPRGFKSRHSSHKKLLIAFAMRSFLYEVCLSAREGRFAWEGRLPIEKGLRAWAAHFPSRFPKENPSRGSAALPFPRSGNLHQIALTIWATMVN